MGWGEVGWGGVGWGVGGGMETSKLEQVGRMDVGCVVGVSALYRVGDRPAAAAAPSAVRRSQAARAAACARCCW